MGKERTVRCIAERFAAGDSLAALADDYRMNSADIERAIRDGFNSLFADLRLNCADPCGECDNCEARCES